MRACGLLLVLCPLTAAAATVNDAVTAVAGAAAHWDLAAAEAALDEARSLANSDAERLVRAEAALLVAELLRVDYEQTPEADRVGRRELGRRIDAAAEEGLAALAGQRRRSEHYRVEADLLGTMIRSDFRAQQYLDRMKAATSRALELDRDNARAWVTAAKPLIFADEQHGRDLVEALRLLDHALELEPTLESANLLRAHVLELRGETEKAAAVWRHALERNPACRPALQHLGLSD